MVDVLFKQECDSQCPEECDFVSFEVVSATEREFSKEEVFEALWDSWMSEKIEMLLNM